MNNEAIDLARQKKIPFRTNRGQRIDHTILVKNEDGSNYDFSAHTAEMYVYNSFSKTTTPEYTVTVTLSSGEMHFAHVPISILREELVYQLWITDATAYRQVWLNGPFLILNREWNHEDGHDTIIISPDGDEITLIVPSGSSLLKSSSTEISSAQILDWHNTEVDILPAPGAGKIVRAVSIDLLCRFGTTPYTFSGGTQQITPCYGSNTSVNAGTAAGTFLTLVTSVDKIVGLGPPGLETFNHNLSLLENQKISIKHLSGGSYVGGDGTIKVLTTYFIINL